MALVSPAVAAKAADSEDATLPEHSGPSPFPRESYAVELHLLRRAQAAYAGGDFRAALAQVAEHQRRFPNGRLSEEREALRVRSLLSSGETDRAHLAYASFTRRFPRSVLRLRLEEILNAAQ